MPQAQPDPGAYSQAFPCLALFAFVLVPLSGRFPTLEAKMAAASTGFYLTFRQS